MPRGNLLDLSFVTPLPLFHYTKIIFPKCLYSGERRIFFLFCLLISFSAVINPPQLPHLMSPVKAKLCFWGLGVLLLMELDFFQIKLREKDIL